MTTQIEKLERAFHEAAIMQELLKEILSVPGETMTTEEIYRRLKEAGHKPSNLKVLDLALRKLANDPSFGSRQVTVYYRKKM